MEDHKNETEEDHIVYDRVRSNGVEPSAEKAVRIEGLPGE
jgi:hypothetical protein